MENWKSVPDYENIYEVSDHGNLRRIARTCPGTQIRTLKGSVNKGAYKGIYLYKNGKAKHKYVHQLVLQCFSQKSGTVVNHIDGHKNNNHISNLEYCTHKENNLHAYKIGLKKGAGRKLSNYMITEMRLLRPLMSYPKLAKRYNVSVGTIAQVINNETYKLC